VCRRRIAGSVFCPIRISGIIPNHGLAIDSELQREVRIDKNELPEQFTDFVGINFDFVIVGPEHRDARPCHHGGSCRIIPDDWLLLDLVDGETDTMLEAAGLDPGLALDFATKHIAIGRMVLRALPWRPRVGLM
jgi:hypothetical protein